MNTGMIAGHLSRLQGICCIDCITDENKKGHFGDLTLNGRNVGRYSGLDVSVARSAMEVSFTLYGFYFYGRGIKWL